MALILALNKGLAGLAPPDQGTEKGPGPSPATLKISDGEAGPRSYGFGNPSYSEGPHWTFRHARIMAKCIIIYDEIISRFRSAPAPPVHVRVRARSKRPQGHWQGWQNLPD